MMATKVIAIKVNLSLILSHKKELFISFSPYNNKGGEQCPHYKSEFTGKVYCTGMSRVLTSKQL